MIPPKRINLTGLYFCYSRVATKWTASGGGPAIKYQYFVIKGKVEGWVGKDCYLISKSGHPAHEVVSVDWLMGKDLLETEEELNERIFQIRTIERDNVKIVETPQDFEEMLRADHEDEFPWMKGLFPKKKSND